MKMNKRRTRKEQRQDSQEHYSGLAENTPNRKAIKKFKRPPAYQVGKLVVEQARQMERNDIKEGVERIGKD